MVVRICVGVSVLFLCERRESVTTGLSTTVSWANGILQLYCINRINITSLVGADINCLNNRSSALTLVCSFRQRRVAEGAAMLRTKGEAGTGNVVEAVRHARSVHREIRMVSESFGHHCAWVGSILH